MKKYLIGISAIIEAEDGEQAKKKLSEKISEITKEFEIEDIIDEVV